MLCPKSKRLVSFLLHESADSASLLCNLHELGEKGKPKMPLFERDRYQRLDDGGVVGAGANRRPASSFCSSATIVVFVALCLVAAWMMASSNNIAVTVSPENKSEAKDQAGSVDLAQSDDRAGDTVSDTSRTSNDEAGDAGKKDDVTGGGGTTPTTSVEAGSGDTSSKDDDVDTGKKDVDAAGETDTTGNSTTGGTDAEESGSKQQPAGGTVGEGETTSSKNQTFSDENGKTEGGEVAKPEDPDKKVEQNAELAMTDDAKNTTTSSEQAEKNTDQNTDESGGQEDNEEQ